MAKTKNNSIDSDFDLDANLDFDDFDFPDLDAKDDRKPIIKVATGIVKGAGEGIRDTAFLKQSLKDVLPKGYGQSLDLTDKVTESVRSLYDESAKEIKPAIKETKRVIAKLVPKESKLVPKSVLAMIKRWEEEKSSESGALSKASQQEAMLSSQMNDIFKLQMEQAVKGRAEDEGKDRLKEGIDLSRHRDLTDILMRSSVSLDRLEKYQSNITLGFQKKSLELQFRHLFATQSLLEFQKEDSVKRDAILLAISKNSMLPEAVKITSSEAKNALGRNKFNERIHQGIFGGRDEYIEKTLTNIKDIALSKVKGAAGGLMAGLGAADMMSDSAGSMPGMDGYTEAGKFAGGIGAQQIGKWVGRKTKAALNSDKLDRFGGKKILSMGHRLEDVHENIGQKVNAFRKSDKYDYDETIKGSLMRGLQSLIPGMGPDTSTEVFKAKDMNSPYVLTRRTDKSINEIIPGYLSRILREMQILRTGDKNIELTQYSFDQGKFTSKGKIEAAAFKQIISPNAAKRTQGQLDQMLNQIDPEGKLSSDARKELKKKLITNSTDFNEANEDNLGKYTHYGDKTGEEIVPLIKKFLGGLEGDKKTQFSKDSNRLAEGVSDPRAAIQEQINLGNIQYLKKMGFVDKSGTNIDMDKVIDHMINPSMTKGAKPSVTKAPTEGAGAFKSIAQLLNPKKSIIGNVKESANNIKSKVTDIFAPGELKPRMSAIKMELGHYRDKLTGAIIRHQSMITGVVEDTSNNNNIVVELDDIPRLAYINAKTKALQGIEYTKKIGKESYAKNIADPNSKSRSILKQGTDKLQETYGAVKEKATDIFAPGELKPRMSAIKMELGHYRDRITKEIITHQSMITGVVEDTSNNNNIVVELDDIPKLAYVNAKTKTLKGIKYTKKIGKESYAKHIADPNTITGKILKQGTYKLQEAYGAVKEKATDVFVAGEEHPRMLAVKMELGHYKDRITGAIIRHQNDIKGVVEDENKKTVVGEEDLPSLRIWNVQLKKFTVLKSIGRAIASVAKAAWWFQTKVAVPWTKWNLKMVGKATKASVSIAKGILGIGPGKVKDVYVGNEPDPRLYATRLKAGEYRIRDTGERIYHQNQITGVIIDRDDQIKLDDDDMPNLKVYDSVLKMLNPFPLIGKIMKGIAKGAWVAQKKLTSLSISMVKGLGSLAGKAIGKLVRLVSKPQDVLVKGETTAKLTGIVMKAGGYFSAITKKMISLPSDIDGAVLDAKGETVLTEDEFKRGLVDVSGNPIRTSAIGTIKKGLGKLNKLLSRRVSLPMIERGKSTKDILKDKVATAGDKTVVLLQDVKSILDKHFNPKKSLLGDTDGDGDRDNSYQDKKKNKVSDAEALARKKGFLVGGAEKANAGKDKKDKQEEDDEGLSALDALDAASDAKDLLGDGRKAKGAGKVGRMAKYGKYLKGAAGVAGKSLGLAGATYGAYSAYGSLKEGNYGDAALSAGGAGLGVAMTAGGLSAVGGTLATVGGGLLATLASPVVLGAGAIALAGYGGYALYKRATRDSLSNHEKLRYVQYGFMANQPSNAAKILELESYLSGFLKTEEELSINEKDLDIKRLVSPWGLDPKDATQLKLFFGWYQNRFKPVYLTHLTAIKAITGKVDLSGADNLKGDDFKKFVEAAKFSDGPYNYSRLPTLDKDTKVSNASDVQAAVDELLKTITDGKGISDKATTVAAVTGAVAATVALDANGKPSVVSFDASQMNSPNAKLPNLTVAAVSTVSSETMPSTGKISALDAVRFKAYGLVEMDSSKVVSLHLLEKAVKSGVSYSGASVASWKGNPMAILEELTGSFGMSDIYGKEANDWAVWFKNRFLPIYMGYLSAFKVFTGKDDGGMGAFMLKPEQQLQLANILVGLKGIWSELTSPWPNYKMGSDSDAAKLNIELLEDSAKKTKLEEEKKTSSKNASVPQEQTSLFSKIKNALNPFASDKKDIKGYAAAVSPDAEVKVNGSPGGASPSGLGAGSAGAIPMAGGQIVDGRNAAAYLDVKGGVDLNRMNPALLKNFYGMVEEYGTLTGNKVGVNDGFRSYADQVAMKKKYGNRAAEPGSSLHEFGLAMDVDPKTLDTLDKMGLMKKYGFTRPVGAEPWHMEPIGIQGDITGYKKNVDSAIEAVTAGLGKGGGGLGTIASAPKYTRNRDLSMSIMAANSTPNVDNKSNVATAPVGGAVSVAQASTPSASLKAPSASSVPSGAGTDANVTRASFAANTDGETKPKGGTTGKLSSAISSSNSPANISARPNTMAADPSVKVPDANGTGYAGYKDMIEGAAKMVGVDPEIMIKMAAIESGFNPGAKSGSSSASGLFQFVNDTWSAVIDKYGRKYGYSKSTTDPKDPKANTIMAAHYIKETTSELSKRVRRAIGATEAYIGHFMGAGGATTFLNALDENPGSIGASILPKAAASNKNIFYNGNQPRTVAEIYSILDEKVRNKAKQFGINTTAAPATVFASNSAPKSTGNATAPALPNQPSGMMQASYKAPAKPTVATQATNQTGSPLADSYGFKPMQAAVAVAPSGQPNQLNKEIMLTTENLLGQSVDIQKKMLEVMSNIFGIISTKSEGGKATATPPSSASPKASADSYKVPKGTVPMTRTMA